MTIALGLLVKDCVIVAADTQETYPGTFKVSQGKLLGAVNKARNVVSSALVVSGAGSAGHLDALQQKLCDGFSRHEPSSTGVARRAFEQCVAAFHAEHITPFAHLPEYERPACSMIAATWVGKDGELVTTERTAVRVCSFGAVGIGAPYANLLLSRLYRPDYSWRAAITVAAFVMFNVKQSIDGCGNDTQLVVLKRRQAFAIPSEVIEEMEKQFAKYQDMEGRALRYALGHGPRVPRPRGLPGIKPDFRGLRIALSEIFKRGLAERLSERRLPVAVWVAENPSREARSTPRSPKRGH